MLASPSFATVTPKVRQEEHRDGEIKIAVSHFALLFDPF